MYCPHCGTENSNLAKFCTSCGGNLSGDPSPATIPQAEYAGFWMRFLATVIDGLILLIPTGIVAVIGVVIDMSIGDPYGNTFGGGRILAYLINLVIGWLYFALMESSAKQATIGKLTLGLKITDTDGNRLTFGRATGRYFAKMINSFTLSIGYIMAAFTQKKQGLHDLIASTVVVKR